MGRKQGKSKENVCLLKQSRVIQVVSYTTFCGAFGNIARCIIWTQREISNFFSIRFVSNSFDIRTLVITIMTQ